MFLAQVPFGENPNCVYTTFQLRDFDLLSGKFAAGARANMLLYP